MNVTLYTLNTFQIINCMAYEWLHKQNTWSDLPLSSIVARMTSHVRQLKPSLEYTSYMNPQYVQWHLRMVYSNSCRCMLLWLNSWHKQYTTSSQWETSVRLPRLRVTTACSYNVYLEQFCYPLIALHSLHATAILPHV